MANPNFPSDGQAERIDALVDASGAVYMKFAVAPVTVSGATSQAASHGVATHAANNTSVGAGDGVVMVAGINGTSVKRLLTDSSGNLQVIGAGAAGAAATGNPLLMAGSDATNARTLLTDASGRQVVVGAAATGAAVAGNPVLVAGSDGTNARSLTTDTAGNLNIIQGESAHATYVATVSGVAATGASDIIAIEAPAGSKVYIRRVIIWQTGTDTSNGIVAFQLLRTTTAGSGGTITPAQMDTSDSAYGGIVRSMGTAGTHSTVLFNIPLDVPNAASAVPVVILDFDNGRLGKGPIIPAGTANGIALVSPGATGAASFSASIEFSL